MSRQKIGEIGRAGRYFNEQAKTCYKRHIVKKNIIQEYSQEIGVRNRRLYRPRATQSIVMSEKFASWDRRVTCNIQYSTVQFQ